VVASGAQHAAHGPSLVLMHALQGRHLPVLQMSQVIGDGAGGVGGTGAGGVGGTGAGGVGDGAGLQPGHFRHPLPSPLRQDIPVVAFGAQHAAHGPALLLTHALQGRHLPVLQMSQVIGDGAGGVGAGGVGGDGGLGGVGDGFQHLWHSLPSSLRQDIPVVASGAQHAAHGPSLVLMHALQARHLPVLQMSHLPLGDGGGVGGGVESSPTQ